MKKGSTIRVDYEGVRGGSTMRSTMRAGTTMRQYYEGRDYYEAVL